MDCYSVCAVLAMLIKLVCCEQIEIGFEGVATVEKSEVLSPLHVLHANNNADFDVIGCKETILKGSDGYFILSQSSNGDIPHCMAIFRPQVLNLQPKKITVEFWNEIGKGDPNYGHPGIIYNYKDPINYQAVFFRPHSVSGCYQSLYIRKGKAGQVVNGECPEGPPAGRMWFSVEFFVEVNRFVIYLNGLFVTEIRPGFSYGGKIGVMMLNGFWNEVHFKNLAITGETPQA